MPCSNHLSLNSLKTLCILFRYWQIIHSTWTFIWIHNIYTMPDANMTECKQLYICLYICPPITYTTPNFTRKSCNMTQCYADLYFSINSLFYFHYSFLPGSLTVTWGLFTLSLDFYFINSGLWLRYIISLAAKLTEISMKSINGSRKETRQILTTVQVY